jgi:tRNA(adenine34) deaminase
MIFCNNKNVDKLFMDEAIKEAQKAFDVNEIPVGAVVVLNGNIISRAYNQVQLLQDSTAHAEILAITAAFNYLGAKYLTNCTLYVTLEPCCMCAGALYWSKLERLVYGSHDIQKGFSLYKPTILHPSTSVTNEICTERCTNIIKNFFNKLRYK